MEKKGFLRTIILVKLAKWIKFLPFILALIAVMAGIYDFGFKPDEKFRSLLVILYKTGLFAGLLSLIVRYLTAQKVPSRSVIFVDIVLILLIAVLFFVRFDIMHLPNFKWPQWVFTTLIVILIREFSSLNFDLPGKSINPALLFIISFAGIILTGALLLLLPSSTNQGISFIDALFTSTSAVCVTGLTVVDTGTYYTSSGQTILIVLMQLGGLGILTFTSYFSYFFKGSASYEDHLLLKDLINTSKFTDIFKTLRRVIITTFVIEAIGALIIYLSINISMFSNAKDRLFFSIFHSVSGFCNAGFSTLPNNLYELSIRYNYVLQLTVAFLIILGGLGFPIVFNFMHYLKHLLLNRFLPYLKGLEPRHYPWVININTRIVVITTTLLITIGTLFFYIFEYNNTLAEHNSFGKIVTAFFGAVTPRTAGFNSVDMAALNFYTILMIFFLMWVGGSPASTAGGIKTSTLAISVLNFLSLAKGKDRIEIFRREISNESIKRAYAIITLSIIILGLSIISLSYFDGDKDLRSLAFECFSALGTVGLSLGITAKISVPGKYILVLTMFIGRVGMLTILMAIFNRIKHYKYRYPTEEIMIN